jgi:hypothetical protein
MPSLKKMISASVLNGMRMMTQNIKANFFKYLFPWFSMGTAGETEDFGLQPLSFIIIRKNLQSQKSFKPAVFWNGTLNLVETVGR